MTDILGAWRAALRDAELPLPLVDLDVLDANTDTLLAQLRRPDLTLRLATKSLRVPAILRHLLDRDARVQGLMCVNAREAALLVSQGFDDLLIAYPPSGPAEAQRVAALTRAGSVIRALVDDPVHLQWLSEAALSAGCTVRVGLDLDAAWRPTSSLHLGVRRSPLHTPEAALSLARAAQALPGLELDAFMAYEAQVAGIPDAQPAWRAPAIRLLKQRTLPDLAARRAALRDGLHALGITLRVINGGGTGSLSASSADPSLTELSAGSGFYAPTLFDGYRGLSLRPAAVVAVPVVRHPGPGMITVAGGGYIASGTPGPDRSPTVLWPPGWAPLAAEGFGEVQTPLSGPGPQPAIGSAVLLRPAKAGEWLERFAEVLLVRGAQVIGRAPTYRGLGLPSL